jgi:small subunit ribosomal protein S16
MLVIRFSRTGKTKQANFKLIVSEKTKDPWGNYLENLGNYNPRTKVAELKADRIKYWLAKGAQPSATVWNLLVSKGITEGKKQKVTKISKKRAAKIAEAKKKEEPVPVVPIAAEVKAEEAPKAEAKVKEEPVPVVPIAAEVKAEEEPKAEAKAKEAPKAEEAPKADAKVEEASKAEEAPKTDAKVEEVPKAEEAPKSEEAPKTE